jgi:hypothetical protein
VPGFSAAESCGVTATTVPEVEFAIVQFPLLNGPTPSPSGPVTAGEIVTKVIATVPAVATENVKTSEPFGARVPLNESVVEVLVDVVVDGDVGLPNRLLSWVQADMIDTDARSRSDNKSRRTFMLFLSAQSRGLINDSLRLEIDYSVPVSALGREHDPVTLSGK